MKIQCAIHCYLLHFIFFTLCKVAKNDSTFLMFSDLEIDFWSLGYRMLTPKNLLFKVCVGSNNLFNESNAKT